MQHTARAEDYAAETAKNSWEDKDMAVFRPFKAVRPAPKMAAEVAALPYDVMSSAEAREMVSGLPWSFLHVDKAEIDLPPATDPYSDIVYEKANENLQEMIKRGVLIRDDVPSYFIYREIMGDRSQTGIVGCASIDDYERGVIKKHENTVAVKEKDRIRHVDATDANTGVIFLAFRDQAAIVKRMKEITEEEPLYDFTSNDVRHTVWQVSDPQTAAFLERSFERLPALYIADGHHRTASAVRVGEMRRKAHPGYTGEEEFNFFLAAAFPMSELSIWDYNRVAYSLGGLSAEEFLKALRRNFDVSPLPDPWDDTEEALMMIRPQSPHLISMLLGSTWYSLKAKPQAIDLSDPVRQLDCSILQDKVLTPILGIKDPRTDNRIAFVGGIRGMRALVRAVAEGAACAFAMYPTAMEDLMNVADAGRIMPPKSTWFEPKLLSGLFIHELEGR